MDSAIATAFSVDRKLFVKALEQIGRVIPTRSGKQILQCVRITAQRGLLKLAGTDLENSLGFHVWGDGELPECVVPCQELLRRVKTGKGETCELSYDGDVLIVNGGVVHHQLKTEDPKEYPPLRFQQDGNKFAIQMRRFREALKVVLVGIAKESTRYAINGVLLEVSKGARLVTTDGRRLVVRELLPPMEVDVEFSVILPAQFCKLLTRLTDTRNEEDALWLWVKANTNEKGEKTPSDVWAIGLDWMLHSLEVDGHFPAWREVIPKNESKFLLDRQELLGLVREVSTAAGETSKGIHLRLGKDKAVLSCRSGSGAESSGEMPCRFLGGGDSLILTGFNPEFLEDVLSTLGGKSVCVEAKQNTAFRDVVSHYAAVFQDWSDRSVRWVLMPVNTGVAPGHESRGSNWQEAVAA